MDFLIALAALCFLMFVAYRGFSVILFAPIAAMGAVLLTDPHAVPAAFTGLFMDKMVGFAQNYFPVFLLGAVFGKVIEMSGFAKSIVAAIIRVVGKEQAMLAIVLVCAVLTYGGVSLFVVVFAAYPFAAEMFRAGDIPKRLIPGTIALGAFTFTMDSLPFTPQIQNIIPTTYFKTTTGAAPILGIIGAIFILVCGMTYLEWQKRRARARRRRLRRRPHQRAAADRHDPSAVALDRLPAADRGVRPQHRARRLPRRVHRPDRLGLWRELRPQARHGPRDPDAGPADPRDLGGRGRAGDGHRHWCSCSPCGRCPGPSPRAARRRSRGALLAAMNTATEYGFGGVIASLPGFLAIRDALGAIPNPLVNEAITVTSLAGITGSASGGMSIALAAMSKEFIDAANAVGIPMEVLHRVAAMASGGMDTLPHNGAVITLLAVTGLTHRESYKDIFAVTFLKTAAVFVVIGVY